MSDPFLKDKWSENGRGKDRDGLVSLHDLWLSNEIKLTSNGNVIGVELGPDGGEMINNDEVYFINCTRGKTREKLTIFVIQRRGKGVNQNQLSNDLDLDDPVKLNETPKEEEKFNLEEAELEPWQIYLRDNPDNDLDGNWDEEISFEDYAKDLEDSEDTDGEEDVWNSDSPHIRIAQEAVDLGIIEDIDNDVLSGGKLKYIEGRFVNVRSSYSFGEESDEDYLEEFVELLKRNYLKRRWRQQE